MTYRVSLRFLHPSIDPKAIIAGIGLQAEFHWKAGTRRQTPTGQELEGINEETYCCFELAHEQTEELAESLQRVALLLSERKDLIADINSTGGRVEIFIGWFVDKNCGEILQWELLKSLGDLGIDLALDIYPPQGP